MRDKFKAFKLTIKAFQQPSYEDASIYLETAYKLLKPTQVTTAQQPLKLQHLTPSFFAVKNLLSENLPKHQQHETK